jgi:fructose-bisphosphate aldolase, class I
MAGGLPDRRRIAVGDRDPGERAALARYAAACQQAGLVPVVEPEVLMAGDHSLSQCEAVTSLVLLQVCGELQDYGVDFGAIVLKPNMVLAGSGVAFLSGGQRPERATGNLAALQQIPRLWPFTFSFGRALVDPALAAWRPGPGDGRPAGTGPAGRHERGRAGVPVHAGT